MRIEHDFHLHTNLSLYAKREVTATDYVASARRLGLKKLGFSDHFWDAAIDGANKFYQPQHYEHICLLKPELEKLRCDDLQIYFGCETEYDPLHHGVAITEATAEQLDFLLVPNSHTHMMMPKDLYEPYEKHKQFMIDAYNNIINSEVSKYILSMAHPFEAVCCPYPNSILMKMMSDDEYKRVFDSTAEKNIAVEVNTSGMSAWDKQTILDSENLRMFRIAKECGCKFTFGSDSHTDRGHDTYEFVCRTVSDALGLKEDDLAKMVR